MPRSWTSGTQILIRYLQLGHEQVGSAVPVTVVEDDGDRLVTFLRCGTPCKWSNVDFDSGRHHGPHDHIWDSTNRLEIVRTGDSHAVSVMWEASGPFRCWYVDLQEPVQRLADGILTRDLRLDIVVARDLTWRWKDQDHFERIQDLGWISPAEALSIQNEADRVVRRIEEGDEESSG